ncbi:nucleotidyltransferase domain-containing protein [Alkaliphilus crotonatoxidans]
MLKINRGEKILDTVENILIAVKNRLKDIKGVEGIVLGGSRARGTHRPDSDIDIGIYYDESVGIDIKELNDAASELDDERRSNIIVPPGAWGEWINGGGWLVIEGNHVDFILRDIKRVEGVIQDCSQGKITAHYHTGHPHAYINAMYMGELSISRILYDAKGQLLQMQGKTKSYPPKMKKAVIDYFMFEAGFSHMFAADNGGKDDLYYVAGHVVRSVSCLNQVIFALNEQYCINEKKAVKMIDSFHLKPVDYKARIDRLFINLPEKTGEACEELAELIHEVQSMIDEN